MALLGKGFSDSKPTDADFVNNPAGKANGATDIRSLKQVLKDFFGAMLNVETGKFKSNVIPQDALQPLTPNPEGVYRKATVNKKGLVTGGELDPEGEPKYRLRAFLSADPNFQSIQEKKDGTFINIPFVGGSRLAGITPGFSYDGYLSTPGHGFYFRTLDFFVPDRVTEIKYYLFQPYSVTASTAGSVRIGMATVETDMAVRLILGTDEGLVSGVLGSRIRIDDYSKDIGTAMDGVDHDPTGPAHTNYFKSSSINYGASPLSNTAKYMTPGFGFAILEWFEV